MTSDLDRRFPGTEVPDSLRGILLDQHRDIAMLLAPRLLKAAIQDHGTLLARFDSDEALATIRS